MSAPIRLNIFAGAFDKVPKAQEDLTWAQLCDELEALTRETTPTDKKNLLAFTLGVLVDNARGKKGEGSAEAPCNLNANYLNHTALVIDVDRCDLAEIEQAIEHYELDAFVYASPSDPNPDDSRRLRVVVRTSGPIAPEHVKHCRKALAELLGIGPGQGVESAMAVSQLMFIGALEGTPEREWRRYSGGEALDVQALIDTPLELAWEKERKPSASSTPLERLAIADPDERTAALLEALLPLWDAPGEVSGRRQILRGLGGYLAKRGWGDEQIAALARALPTERPEAVRVALVLDCARDARRNPGEAAGWSTLAQWNPDAAAVIESVAKDPREPEGFAGVWSERWAFIEARAAAKLAARGRPAGAEPFAPAADGDKVISLFLRSRNGCVTLMWEGDERGHRPIADRIVRTRVRELGYETLVELNGKRGPVPAETLLETYGNTFVHTSYAFANRITQYEPAGEGRVTIGYPLTLPVACFDAHADAWLRALGGEHYDRLAIWIASCSQKNIDRLSACLVLVGEKNVGKSLFGLAVARMWGESPPPLALVNAQFNADMQRCPILVDEEAQLFGSKALSTKRFRDVIQARFRSIELKGKERCQLHGALRAIVSCNGYSDLRFSDLGGPAVVAALRDRMLVIDALERTSICAAALAPMQNAIDQEVDLDRIAAHMAWLCETVELPAERFLGAGGADSESAILAGHIDEHVDLWELFRDWLEADGPSKAWHAHAEHGLCADTSALAESLENTGRGWDHRQVRTALAPFHTASARLGSAGSARPRVWVLDALRIAEAMQLDLEGLSALERRLDVARAPQPRAQQGRFGAFGRFSR